jgi:hypothetical protein
MSPSKLLTLIFTYSIVGLSLVLVFLLLSENEDEINVLLINTVGSIICFQVFTLLCISGEIFIFTVLGQFFECYFFFITI